MIAPVVTLTEIAQKHALRAIQKKGGRFLRLGVRGGGCSGLSYVMRPDTEISDRDRAWMLPSGLQVVVDQKRIKFLEGTTIDYDLKNLLDGGFRFDNPNSVKSCGCGTSFTPR
ncbi:MAG TPA: iron-sulfur cluster assembly accessory protein [Planctomycetaceae bacterium]|nr:iron-sulfur cluster assembly accessory protein [Planctomycetaceae bacterium]